MFEVGGWTSEESSCNMLFRRVKGLSSIDIIALLAPGTLGVPACCTDAWLYPEQFNLLP